MKRKLFILALMLTLVASIFIISASGATTTSENENFQGGVLYKSTTNEFGTVNYAVSGKITPDSKFDTTSRVVLKNDDNTYSTYPSAYIYNSDNYGDTHVFTTLKTISGQDYDVYDIIRIEVPEGTNHIRTFKSCSELLYVKIPSTVGTIRGNSFQNCTNLVEVEFGYDFVKYPQYGSNLTTVSNGQVFSGCSLLERLVFPNSVTTIGNAGFSGCDSLNYLNLGLNFTTVDGGVSFSSPKNLKTLVLTHNFKGAQKTFGDASKYTYGTDFVIYYTGSLSDAQSLQGVSGLPCEITKSTLVSYDEFTDESFVRDTTVHYFVYGYNACDAFYNGKHNYEGTGNCLDGVTCTQCGDNIASFKGHNMVETLVYDSFLLEGKYNKFCSNASDCAVDRIKDGVAPAIFGSDGFSTKGEDGIASGYVVNVGALEKYNELNDDITFGIMVVNPNYLDGKESFLDAEGKVNTSGGALQVNMTENKYSNISVAITGFTGNAQGVSLVIALYAYTDVGEVEFVQSQTTKCADAKVTLGEQMLYTVTLASVKSANSDLSDLGDYIMPSQKEQE